MSKSWASTLRLPKSTLPPRPLPEFRQLYLERCTDAFYKWQEASRPVQGTFTIHDGPPYANGSLHVGHGLNKILKDMILRAKVQQGRRVRYVPGWDCHGLPIELKAVGEGGGRHMAPVAVRAVARDLASKTVLEQMRAFRSYGVMGDWERRWTTMDRAYEVRQLRLFQEMVQRGLVYRRYKPVYWSPSSRTALAEAELEYNEDHVSTAAYVMFPLVGTVGEPAGTDADTFAVVWTTTPWTLPANQAIAVHKDLDYSIVKVGNRKLIVARDCLEHVCKACFPDEAAEVVEPRIPGAQLLGKQYHNRLHGSNASPRPFIHAGFVSPDSGSGLVHIAPGHGFEDYEVCSSLSERLPVTAPVDGEGCFSAEAYPDEPERLEGLSVQRGGSKAVLDLLQGFVLKTHKYRHKYPYDWRTKEPIIVRATAQWFTDVAAIKDQALAALDGVRFIPETGKNRLESFVKGRSEWCISRQRAWGVPIPALYSKKDGKAHLSKDTVEHIISVVQDRGTDAWWSDSPDEPAWIPKSLGDASEFRRGRDTMDVWFDSGSSWTQTDSQADVYLEGTDQHRGWFQSSLLTRVAAQDRTQLPAHAPFKTLITHGFTLDAKGRKMSKSVGNIVSPDQVMDGTLLPPIKAKKRGMGAPPITHDALGPDALRLWVASSDYTRDVVIGEPVLKTIHTALIKYRTIIKMLLGSIHQAARGLPLTALDHIAVVQLRDTMDEVGKAYEKHEFYKAFSSLNRWVTNDLSAFYLEALKDRLYCADGGGVLEAILTGFLRMLAPITPVLVEEAWDHAPAWLKEDASTVHPLRQLYGAPVIDAARLSRDESRLRRAVPAIMAAHAAIKSASELARNDKALGSSLQCSVILDVPDADAASLLREHADELEAMFVVSSVALNAPVPADAGWKYSQTFELDGGTCTAWVLPPEQAKCPRCWRYVAPEEEKLCGRCEEVVGNTGL